MSAWTKGVVGSGGQVGAVSCWEIEPTAHGLADDEAYCNDVRAYVGRMRQCARVYTAARMGAAASKWEWGQLHPNGEWGTCTCTITTTMPVIMANVPPPTSPPLQL